ncbi:MAG: hypothetical protein AAGA76_13435 [Pseudomonadota bacterium]
MPSPVKGFVWVFGMTVLFGLLVGTLNLLNPDAVHIPFGTDENGNAQSAEGLDGVIAATASSAVLGIIFGGLAAIIAWMFRAGVNKAAK